MAARNSAPNSRYSPARAPITAIKERALLMGCRCASRFTAPATETAPKVRNKIRCRLMKSALSSPISVFSKFCSFSARTFTPLELRTEHRELENLPSLPCHGHSRRHHIGNCHRQQELPSERHELVVTEAWQCTPYPYIDEEEYKDFRHKPKHRKQRLENRRSANRAMPSPEEQESRQAGNRDHVGVLSHEEHGKFHGAVFRVISRHQLRLSLGQVKRDTIGFCVGGDKVDQESNDLPLENVPTGDESPECSPLGIHYRAKTKTSGHDENAHQRQPERNFVAHHLRAGAQPTQ